MPLINPQAGSRSITGSPAIKGIHDRQPVIVPPDRQHDWLHHKLSDPAKVMQLLEPAGDVGLKFYRVSTNVNSGTSEGEDLIAPIEADTASAV